LATEQPDAEGNEGGRRRLVLATVIALAVLLLLWLLFWPVPPAARRHERTELLDRDTLTGTSVLQLGSASVRVERGACAGSKGVVLRIRCEVANLGERVPFEAGCLALEVGGAAIPPLDSSHCSLPVSCPKELPAGCAARVEALFAVPKGEKRAKLVLRPSNVPAEEAPALALALPHQEGDDK